MIEAKSLMLNNWINFHDDDTMFQVIEIYNSGVRVKNEIEETWIELDRFSGIILTPVILEKCGFQEVDHFQYEAFKYSDNKGIDINVVMRDNCDPFFCWINKRDDAEYSVNIKYLHQFQNLYYSLTGTELPINL